MSEILAKVDKTLRYHGRRGLRVLRGAWWDVLRPPADRPVFVIGCSRAGTTLVYKTLGQSEELGTHNRETHDFWSMLHPPEMKHWDTHALTAADACERDRRHVTRCFYVWTGMRRWVDKNNQNGLCVPYLHALFPDAYFVYVKRSPADNINSLIEGWGKEGKFSTWSEALPTEVAIDGGSLYPLVFFSRRGLACLHARFGGGVDRVPT